MRRTAGSAAAPTTAAIINLCWLFIVSRLISLLESVAFRYRGLIEAVAGHHRNGSVS